MLFRFVLVACLLAAGTAIPFPQFLDDLDKIVLVKSASTVVYNPGNPVNSEGSDKAVYSTEIPYHLAIQERQTGQTETSNNPSKINGDSGNQISYIHPDSDVESGLNSPNKLPMTPSNTDDKAFPSNIPPTVPSTKDSTDLALIDDDDFPSIPIGSPDSGEINVGPNFLDIIQPARHHSYEYPEDYLRDDLECDPRTVLGDLEKMFLMCCELGPAALKGPGVKDQILRETRRQKCILYDRRNPLCSPTTMECCHCRDRKRLAYDCVPFYDDYKDQLPITPNPQPAPPGSKRHLSTPILSARLIPLPLSAPPLPPTSAPHIPFSKRLDPRPAAPAPTTDDEDDTWGKRKPFESTCTPTFLLSRNVKPYVKKPPPGDGNGGDGGDGEGSDEGEREAGVHDDGHGDGGLMWDDGYGLIDDYGPVDGHGEGGY